MPSRKPQTPTKKAPAVKAPAKKAPAKVATQKASAKPPAKAPAKKAPARKTPAKTPAKVPGKKAAAAKPPAKAPAKKAPARKATAAVKKSASAKVAARRPAATPTRTTSQATPARPSRPVVPAPAVHAPLPRALRDLYASHHQALAPIWDPTSGLTVDIKVPASVALHPTRKRCKACNYALGNEAILRMFCSYACAGLPEPDLNPETAPRPCKRAARSDEAGEWAFKQRFTTPETAGRYLRPGTTLYRCANCFFLHIGNVSAPPTVGIPDAPTSGRGPFEDAVLAVLHGRRITSPSPAEIANVKRDVRAVFDALRKHAGHGGAVRLPDVR
jgi:hypothetical protein